MTKPTMAELIPRNLKMSTAARLRLVADIIELHPERWRQRWWMTRNGYRNEDDPGPVAGTAVAEAQNCGTQCCVAGWATLLTRPAQIGLVGEVSWSEAGAVALGLDANLADRLFDGGINTDARGRRAMVKALRQLADLPAPRTYAAAMAAGIRLP